MMCLAFRAVCQVTGRHPERPRPIWASDPLAAATAQAPSVADRGLRRNRSCQVASLPAPQRAGMIASATLERQRLRDDHFY